MFNQVLPRCQHMVGVLILSTLPYKAVRIFDHNLHDLLFNNCRCQPFLIFLFVCFVWRNSMKLPNQPLKKTCHTAIRQNCSTSIVFCLKRTRLVANACLRSVVKKPITNAFMDVSSSHPHPSTTRQQLPLPLLFQFCSLQIATIGPKARG